MHTNTVGRATKGIDTRHESGGTQDRRCPGFQTYMKSLEHLLRYLVPLRDLPYLLPTQPNHVPPTGPTPTTQLATPPSGQLRLALRLESFSERGAPGTHK